MKSFLLLLLLVLFCPDTATAQDSAGPDTESLTATETPDRERAEAPVARRVPQISDELVDLIQYLQDSPADYDRHKRKIVAKQLENWVRDSPEVSVELSEEILPYLQYGEASTLFVCGYVQYTVAHPVFDPDAASVAGIRSVISYYKDNMHILGRDELLDKLVKLKEKGRLSGFIKRRVN